MNSSQQHWKFQHNLKNSTPYTTRWSSQFELEMESIWVTSLDCVYQWKLLLLLLPLRFHYYQLNYATLQRAESASFSFGLQTSVFSLQFQFQINFSFSFVFIFSFWIQRSNVMIQNQCHNHQSLSVGCINDDAVYRYALALDAPLFAGVPLFNQRSTEYIPI